MSVLHVIERGHARGYNLNKGAAGPLWGFALAATYLAVFFLSLITTLAGVPLARRLAFAGGFIDKPAARKVHRVPVPLLGGAAIWLGCLFAVALITREQGGPQLAAILTGATLMAAVGLIDDRVGLSPKIKLLAEIVAVGPLILQGVRVESATPWPEVNLVLTVLWVVGITNALNLLDNMDGLAGGIAAIASGFYLLLAASSGQFLVASLAAAIAGATLGYLRFNFLAPARIFMGDAGSLFLGYMLASLGIKLHFDNLPTVTWLIPVLVLGIPLFDTTLVTLSRLRRGLNPLTTPGKDHFSHRLVLVGLTQREAVLVIYMLAGMLGVAAMFLTSAEVVEAYIVGGAFALLAVYGFLRLESVFRATLPGTGPDAPHDEHPSQFTRTPIESSAPTNTAAQRDPVSYHPARG